MYNWTGNSAIVKHSAAVQISNSISAAQRKAWNVLLAYAYTELLSKEEHCISLRLLSIMLDYPRHSHERLKEDLHTLVGTVVEWNIIDRQRDDLPERTEDESWTVCSLLAGATIEGGTIFYSYYPRLRELLYRPATFARIDLLKQSQLRSKHALVLYELCEQYHRENATPLITIAVFLQLMGAENYTEWKDIRRRLITAPVNEVNAVTHFVLTAVPEKKGTKVTHIKFLIRKKI